ncbi:MAG: hypothetical protein ACQKBU_06535 [Verrucomicrobiales bacterium]
MIEEAVSKLCGQGSGVEAIGGAQLAGYRLMPWDVFICGGSSEEALCLFS